MEKQQYVYVDVPDHDEPTGSVTFKGIWKFTKMAARAMLVFVLAAFIAGGAIAGILHLAATPHRFVVGTIELGFPEAALGRLPEGDGIFSMNSIVSSSVLNAAVSDTGFTIDSQINLNNHFSVQAIASQEYIDLRAEAENGSEAAQEILRTREFHPTRFDVRLDNFTALGLTDAQAETLLSTVITEFITEFNRNFFGVVERATNQFAININTLDTYIMHYLRFTRELNELQQFLQTRHAQSSGFGAVVGSSRVTFADLATRIDTQIERLGNISAQIRLHNVSPDPEFELIRLGMRANELYRDVERLRSERDSLEQAWRDSRPIAMVIPGTEEVITIIGNEAEHARLTRELVDFNAVLHRRESELSRAQDLYENFSIVPQSDEVRAQTLALLQLAQIDAVGLISQINALEQAYYVQNVHSTSVRTVQPVAAITQRGMGAEAYILIIAVFAILGVVVSLIFTQVRRTKAIKRAETDHKNAQNIHANQPVQGKMHFDPQSEARVFAGAPNYAPQPQPQLIAVKETTESEEFITEENPPAEQNVPAVEKKKQP